MAFGFKTKTATTTTANTTHQAQQMSEVDGQAVGVVGSSNVVSILDGGAIEQAFGFGGDALGFGGDALGFGGDALERAANLTLELATKNAEAGHEAINAAQKSAEMGYEFAMNAGRSDVAVMQDTTKKVLILAAIVAAAWVARGMLKK